MNKYLSMHTCALCYKNFARKSTLEAHVNKQVCTNKRNRKTCDICNEEFVTTKSLKSHYKSQKHKNKTTQSIKSHNVTTKSLKSHYKSQKHKNKTTTSIKSHNVTTKATLSIKSHNVPASDKSINGINGTIKNKNNVTVKIIINPFLKDQDFSYITSTTAKKILETKSMAIPALLMATNFSAKRPENHCIYISNFKFGNINICSNDGWKLMPLIEATNNILRQYSQKLHKLTDNYNFIVSNTVLQKVNNINKFLINKHPTKEEQIIKTKIAKDLKFIMYNERAKPMLTRKLLEKSNK
jgi:hypothetical protein